MNTESASYPLPETEEEFYTLLKEDPSILENKGRLCWMLTHYFESERSRRGSDEIFVQHIQGYGGEEQYKENEKVFTGAGFDRLRSEKGDDGKYWEIWFLPGRYAAKGPIEGKSKKDIQRWVAGRSPGQVWLNSMMLALVVD